MGDSAEIRQEKLNDLFNELVDKKIIVAMNVVGTKFDRLTCIIGVTKDAKGNHLIVDSPNDFAEAIAAKEKWHLRFNFNGPDHLEYVFSTKGGIFCKQGLMIPFPDLVERLQRRRNFRVNTLPNSKVHFQLNKIQGAFDMINISLGGFYGVLTKHNFKFIRGPILKKDQQINDISMIFPGIENKPGATVYVKRAEVRRIDFDKENKFYRYAFEIIEIEKEERDILTRTIYDLQRYYLRRR